MNTDRTDRESLEAGERLRRERPQLTALELDAVKQRVRQQVRPKHASSRLRAGALLKSRLALTLILVSGLMLSGTGATLAITGDSGSGSAAQSQYTNPGQNDVLGDQQGSGSPNDNGGGGGPDDTNDPGAGNVLGKQGQGPDPGTKGAPVSGGRGDSGGPQTTAQESASRQSGLAFTGFMVIPLLLGGVALTATGGVMRLRLRRDSRG